MNLIEALKLCKETGVAVKAKSWKYGEVRYITEEFHPKGPKTFRHLDYRKQNPMLWWDSETILYLSEDDYFDEWEVVNEQTKVIGNS